MTHYMLAILSLPLAFVVGCEDLLDGNTGDVDDCEDGQFSVVYIDGTRGCVEECPWEKESDGDCPPVEPLTFTVISKAPYGWVGYHRVVNLTNGDNEIARCEDVNECELLIVDPSKYDPSTGRTYDYVDLRMSIGSDTFDCVSQELRVNDDDNGETVDVSDAWLGEGICYLTPEGEYSGMDVWTTVDDENGFDQGWIGIGSWAAVITGNYFFHDGDYFLEGTVSDDLSSIEYTAVSESGNEFGGTINLED